MVRKIIKVAFILLPMTFDVLTQEPPHKLFPITSSRVDVVRELKNGKNLKKNIVLYNFVNEDVTITYYESGCSQSEEQTLKLSKGVVLEISIRKKKPLPLYDIANNSFKKHSFGKIENLYTNSRENFLILTEKTNGIEYVEYEYYLPDEAKLPQCVINHLDKLSGFKLLKSINKEPNEQETHFSPIEIGQVFDEDSQTTKNYALNLFSKVLHEHTEDGFGYVIITRGKNEKIKQTQQKCKNICVHLKNQGISGNKLIFIDGGTGSLPGMNLSVVHKDTIPLNLINSKHLFVCK